MTTRRETPARLGGERAAIFAGFGGQGLLFAAGLLARAAIRDGLETFWIPSYGPEMRGGTASCTVIVAEEAIGSPIVDRYDAAVVMNPPSLEKFGPRVTKGGLLIVNSSLVDGTSGRDDIAELRLPCTAIAGEAGDDSLISVVALGALVERLGWVTPGAVEAALREVVGARRPAILDADLAAFGAGRRAVHTDVAA